MSPFNEFRRLSQYADLTPAQQERWLHAALQLAGGLAGGGGGGGGGTSPGAWAPQADVDCVVEVVCGADPLWWPWAEELLHGATGGTSGQVRGQVAAALL